MKKDMTRGVEWRHIILFALPIMAGNLLQQLYNTVDNVVVGNFVPEPGAFAAVATTAAVTFMLLAFAMGISIGVSVVVAQLFGAREEQRLSVAVDTSLILLGALGVLFAAAGVIFMDPLLRYIMIVPEEQDILRLATLYLRIYCLSLPFQFLYNCVAGILRGVGDSKASLFFLLITSALNVVLTLAFVLVFSWGVAGTAIATAISQAVCAAISYVYLRRRFPLVKGGRHFDGRLCKTVLKIGLPTAVQQSVVAFGNIAMQRLVNGFGESVMEAFGAGNRINHFVFVPIIGFQSALASFTGQNIGANRLDRVKRGFHATLIMGMAATVAICAASYIFASPLIAMFGLSGDSLGIGAEQIRFYAMIYWFFALYMLLGGVLQGAGDTLLQSAATLSALVIRVAVAYVGVYVFTWYGYEAAWETTLFGWIAATAITVIRYLTGGWKNKAVAKRDAET